MKQLLTLFVLTFPCTVLADWVEIATRTNGDVIFYDEARVEKDDDVISVWTRVRYKTSVMAASSYQSHVKLDCAEKTETVLQSTFYTDKNWSQPAMATNTIVKPASSAGEHSTAARLIGILCTD